ncbi:hypothetical protein [Oceanobacillus salinisoli]|nr:hypothetical protein [Oceanobacillus salinisoli]
MMFKNLKDTFNRLADKKGYKAVMSILKIVFAVLMAIIALIIAAFI